MKELEDLLKDLANYKVQLEAKDSAYKQDLLKLDHYRKLTSELSTLLKNSEFEKDIYINKCSEGQTRIEELECKLKEMADGLSEAKIIKDQLSLVTSELNITQVDLRSMEREVDGARDGKIEALTREELMETELEMEKEKTEELVRHISELNETILHLRMASVEAEREKCDILTKKEAEMELVTRKALEADEKLEFTRQELERENQLKLELQNAKEEVDCLNVNAESARAELEKVKKVMEEIRERESEEQVEIAMLKSELHRGRSKIAAAEAAEARAKIEKSRLCLAIQQLAMEAVDAKKENPWLKEKAETASEDVKLPQIAESEAGGKDVGNDNNALMTISKEEYKALIERGETMHEMGNLKKELEIASAKIRELRARAEQAMSRAEAAEMAKAVLEDQLRKRREQREKRRVALAALREELYTKEESSSFRHEQQIPKTYQPLAKILKMKF